MCTRILTVLILAITLLKCQPAAIKNHLFGNYYLLALDVDEQLSLCYHDSSDENNYGTIIGPTVFAIGYNDSFIIIMQHPQDSSVLVSKKKVNYFILPLKQGFNWKTMNGLIGPFTMNQFKSKRKELGIPGSLTFTKEYQSLK